MPSNKKRTSKKFHIDTDDFQSFGAISKALRKIIVKQRTDFKSQANEELNFRNSLRNTINSREDLSVRPKSHNEANLRLNGVIQQIQLCQELKKELLLFQQKIDNFRRDQTLKQHMDLSKTLSLIEKENYLNHQSKQKSELTSLYIESLAAKNELDIPEEKNDQIEFSTENDEPDEGESAKANSDLKEPANETIYRRPLYDQIQLLGKKGSQNSYNLPI